MNEFKFAFPISHEKRNTSVDGKEGGGFRGQGLLGAEEVNHGA